MKGTAKMLWGIIIGASAGAIAGIMLAPDKGSVTRKKIADKAKETGGNIKETVTGKYAEAKDFVNEKMDKVKNKTSDYSGSHEFKGESAESKMNS